MVAAQEQVGTTAGGHLRAHLLERHKHPTDGHERGATERPATAASHYSS